MIGWPKITIEDNEFMSIKLSKRIPVNSIVKFSVQSFFAIFFLLIGVFIFAGPAPCAPKFQEHSMTMDWGEKMLREAGKW